MQGTWVIKVEMLAWSLSSLGPGPECDKFSSEDVEFQFMAENPSGILRKRLEMSGGCLRQKSEK